MTDKEVTVCKVPGQNLYILVPVKGRGYDIHKQTNKTTNNKQTNNKS